MSRPLRIAFFGTPQLAVYVLEELSACGITPTLVVTAPDKPSGRKLAHAPTPVKLWGQAHALPVLQPSTLKEKMEVPELWNDEWDVFVVAAYNLILPEWVLALPKHGVLNVHPSLLPKYRGPSPIRSAIREDARDAVGVTLIALDREVDHGPIVARASVALEEWPIPGRILDELLFREGGRLLAEALEPWVRGELIPEPQDHASATFTRKLVRADGELDLSADPYQNYLRYCAYDGWPGTFFFDQTGQRIKIAQATYTDGVFHIEKVIPEGKREMTYKEYLHNRERAN